VVRRLLKLYFWLTAALAVVAGAIMAGIFLGVVLDVLMRDFGFQSPRAIEPMAEYGLLYITMLGSPWLLRTKGMIIVESFRMVVPLGPRRILEVVVYLASGTVCFLLAWYAGYQTVFSWVHNQADQRAITVPLYYAYAPMSLSFLLMGIEFARRLIAHESLYGQSATEHETI
jgi:C4-dicarboxylate transporter, DctQ subunit